MLHRFRKCLLSLVKQDFKKSLNEYSSLGCKNPALGQYKVNSTGKGEHSVPSDRSGLINQSKLYVKAL